MKATLVSGIFPPDIGGPASYIPKLATHLMGMGYDVHIVSLTDGKMAHREEKFGTVHLVPRRLNKILRIPLVIFQIVKHGFTSKILFANGLYEEAGLSGFLLHRKFVFKIVGDPIWERFQNSNGKIEISTLSFDDFKIPKKFLIQQRIFAWSMHSCAGVTTPSRELAEVIKNRYKVDEIAVIHNGVTIPELDLSGSFKYDLVSVSRLVPWKQVEILIQLAVAKDLKFVVIGDGPEKSKLVELAGLKPNNIIFTGNLPPEEVQTFLRETRIFALLSEYEGMSFSLLEALAAGKRILVSNIPGNVEVLGESQFAEIVDPRELTCLEAAVNRLLPDSDANFNYQVEAHRWAKANYSIDAQLTQMVQYVKGISNE
jgi:glycosyltransferase involved in cell wall biosynthesis